MSRLKYSAVSVISNARAESPDSVVETENAYSKQNVPRKKVFGAN